MTVGAMSNYLGQALKFVHNTNRNYGSSCLSQKIKTQFYLSVTFLLWGWAVGLHLIWEFNKQEDSLLAWIVEIFIASAFAIGFGWHLQKFFTLREEEKRGELYSHIEEFRET